MKLKSMISWALIFSFTFLLFQPLVRSNEIKEQQMQRQMTILQNRLQSIEKSVDKFKQDNEKSRTTLLRKARAESSDLMIDPEGEDMTEQGGGDDAENSDSETLESDNGTSTINSNKDNLDATTDPSGSENEPNTAVILQAPDKVTLGSVATLLTTVWIKDGINETIDKINISIQESSGNVSFKDSFVNYKDQRKFSFTYNWNTYEAQTKADKGSSAHKIIVEAYQKKGNDYAPFQKPIIKEIKVVASQWGGLSKDGFWNNYVEQDGTLSDYWLKKLECSNKDDCKTRKQIQEHLSTVIKKADFQLVNTDRDRSSEFNDDDREKIFDGLVSYKREVDSKNGESNEEMATESLKLIIMSDFVSFMDELIDAERGYEIPKIPEEVLTAPEMHTVFKAIDKWQVKFASYDYPETKEEIKALPFWPEMEKEISDNLSKDSENTIKDIDELKSIMPSQDLETDEGEQVSRVTNFLRPQKAQAVVPVVAAIYILGWVAAGASIYKFIKEPTLGNAAWAVVNTLFAAFGGKIIEWGAIALGKVAVWLGGFLPKIPWLTNVLKPALINFWYKTIGEGILKMVGSPNKLISLLGKAGYALFHGAAFVGKWIATQAGALKKILISGGKIAARVLIWLGLIKASGLYNTECPSLLGKGPVDPFAWALCNILRFVYDLAFSIYKFSLCLLTKSIGTGNTTKKCNFKYGT